MNQGEHERHEVNVNLNVNITFKDLENLLHLAQSLNDLKSGQGKMMALGQDILDAVTAEDTKVDSIITLINQLAASGTIPADVQAAILAKIKGSEDKLDAAITANTPPAP